MFSGSDATFLPAPNGSARIDCRRIDIDDLVAVDLVSEPAEIDLHHAEIVNSPADYLVLTVVCTGSARLQLEDGVFDLPPSSFSAWHARQARRLHITSPLVNCNLLIPRSALEEVGARGRVLCTQPVPLDGLAVASLLCRYLRTTRDLASGFTGGQLVSLRNATLELAVAALAGLSRQAEPKISWPALRSAIDRYIDNHLDDCDLSPASIAAAANISIRTLYRRFQLSGESVSEYIRRRRIARARQDIVAEGMAAKISAIAHRWCFADASHFSREFRRHYGYSPRDLIRP